MRAVHIEALKGRIDRSEYRVDVEKVAVAILGRPTARLWLVPTPPRVAPLEEDRGIASGP